MYSAVKPLRIRGQRRPEREILSSAPVQGNLTLACCAGVPELNLSARDDSTAQPLLPILYEARMIGMHGNKMLFKGLERDPGGAEFSQEWSVMVLGV